MRHQETCLQIHGFFDAEQKSCTTVHRLVKVCLRVVAQEDSSDPDLPAATESATNQDQQQTDSENLKWVIDYRNENEVQDEDEDGDGDGETPQEKKSAEQHEKR